MSLLRELQTLTERTYGHSSGVNLEKFIIGEKRFVHLSSFRHAETRELSDAARVFFRRSGESLYIALYFASSIIADLEANDPRKGLNEKNIWQFMVFIEEISHGVHGAIKFLAGHNDIRHEGFVRDLELQAKIDTYQVLKFFLAYFNPSNRLQGFDRLWIRHHLFERSSADYASENLKARYGETNGLGGKYTRFLDCMSSNERLQEMRRFRPMSYEAKASYIRMLP